MEKNTLDKIQNDLPIMVNGFIDIYNNINRDNINIIEKLLSQMKITELSIAIIEALEILMRYDNINKELCESMRSQIINMTDACLGFSIEDNDEDDE